MRKDLTPGVLLEHSSYTPEELDVATIQLAVEYGYSPSGDLDSYELFAGEGLHGDPADLPDEELAEARQDLRELADEAVDYLSERCAPMGHYVAHDGEAGALGCWEHDEL